MLVCRLEHWPKGDNSRRKDLGVLHVVQVGGDRQAGHYAAQLYGPDGHVIDTAEVPDFATRRLGPWPLLARALDLLVGYQWKYPPLKKGDHKPWAKK